LWRAKRSNGKAALARTRSKTCRFFGGGSAREASWTAECQFRFGPKTVLAPFLTIAEWLLLVYFSPYADL